MKIFRKPKTVSLSTASADEGGFGLAEFLIASAILLLVSAALFSLLAECQGAAGYQTEVEAVLDNVRLAMDTVERYVGQAGNDPLHTGIVGVTILGNSEIRLKSDLTGSAGPADPDKGDPDGDTLDASEDVTIRYNATARSIELVAEGGSAQPIASYISAFSMQYYDANGVLTMIGANVRRINITISAASTVPDPRTRRAFGITLTSDVQIAAMPS